MYTLSRTTLALSIIVAISPQLECSPWFFFIPRPVQSSRNTSTTSAGTSSGTSQQSNVTVALGNRVNTETGLDDYGTSVDGVTLNIARRRRRRDIWDLSSLLGPNAPNGSYIAINNQVFPLPENLSNVSLNVVSIPEPPQLLNLSQPSFVPTIPQNYTNAFQTLVTEFETLPLDAMDGIVQLLSTGYRNSFGQLFLEQGFARLHQALANGTRTVETGLNNLADQAGRGFEQLITRFNGSTSSVQRCVGDNLNPTNVSRSVLNTAYSCVNRKWQELVRLAKNIGQDIVAADNGASQFLTNLTACSAANVRASSTSGTELTTAQLNSLRRQCYGRAIGSFPQRLLFLPVSLAIDGTRLYASISGLEADIAACAGELAVAIGMESAQIGTKILLCQVFPAS
uniref:Uncharacterized protein n=1 Tax=Anopheles farauti TaxID=69004 RepID=A0A1Y9H9L8_9DIPT